MCDHSTWRVGCLTCARADECGPPVRAERIKAVRIMALLAACSLFSLAYTDRGILKLDNTCVITSARTEPLLTNRRRACALACAQDL